MPCSRLTALQVEPHPPTGLSSGMGATCFGTHNLLADALLLVDLASTTGSSSRTAATASTTLNCGLLIESRPRRIARGGGDGEGSVRTLRP